MATLTIRNLDDGLKSRLRVRAAHSGHSMEEEARRILQVALDARGEQTRSRNAPFEGPSLAETMHELFGSIGGVDLPERNREPMRDPPTFD